MPGNALVQVKDQVDGLNGSPLPPYLSPLPLASSTPEHVVEEVIEAAKAEEAAAFPPGVCVSLTTFSKMFEWIVA